MTPRRIYHITHVDNLTAIADAGALRCDALMDGEGGPSAEIGMGRIKRRRRRLPVKSQAETMVAEYVPFYFCPRSVMLYLIYRANAPGLSYRGGQEPIVHLSAPLERALDWVEATGRRWAITFSNASASYARFSSKRSDVERLKWSAIESRDWSRGEIKQSKQSEFLVHQTFPWSLIDCIGVANDGIAKRARRALRGQAASGLIRVQPDWYY